MRLRCKAAGNRPVGCAVIKSAIKSAERNMSEPLVQRGSSRLVSLDAFRGFIMLAMASEGFGFPQMAKQFPDSPVWGFLGSQFSHVPWRAADFGI